jgi:hypothetical protein
VNCNSPSCITQCEGQSACAGTVTEVTSKGQVTCASDACKSPVACHADGGDCSINCSPTACAGSVCCEGNCTTNKTLTPCL